MKKRYLEKISIKAFKYMIKKKKNLNSSQGTLEVIITLYLSYFNFHTIFWIREKIKLKINLILITVINMCQLFDNYVI